MRTFITSLFLFSGLLLQGQVPGFSLDRDLLLTVETRQNKKENNQHSFLKPFNLRDLTGDSFHVPLKEKKSLCFGFLPVTTASVGYALNNSEFIYSYGAGGGINGQFGEKWRYHFYFQSGNSVVQDEIDTMVEQARIIPGIGRAYGSGGKYSWQEYAGAVSFQPNRVFHLEAGKGKHFWGDGYRSMFLSDYASSFPYLKVTANVWKLKYVSMFAMMSDPSADARFKDEFRKKFGTFHALSWNAAPWLNLTLFESIIWQGSDSTRHRNFDLNYLNPVIFFRPVEYSLGSSDNAFLGFAFKTKFQNKYQFYGQALLDEFLLDEIRARRGWWGNKQAYQLGFRWFDIFGVKGFAFRGEINYVRPYTFAHGSVQQNYSHLNQSLAHPLGANFKEALAFLTYQKDKWTFEGKIYMHEKGLDSAGKNFGGNIFNSYAVRPHDYDNYTGQGSVSHLTGLSGRVSYLLFPQYNLKAEISADFRRRHEAVTDNDIWISFGVRSSFYNLYNDF